MPEFNTLKINTNNDILTREKWNGLVDTVAAKIKLTVPTNPDGVVENGLIMHGVTVGTKPDNGKVINYPWAYESVGVKQNNFNLRLQSPKSIFFHTGIDNKTRNTQAQKVKEIRLSIGSNGNVGIGTYSPEKILHIHSPGPDNGLKITSKNNQQAIHLHLAKNSSGEYGYFNLGGKTSLRGNGKESSIEGSLGIGTDKPSAKLHVMGDLVLDKKGNNSILFGASNAIENKSYLLLLNATKKRSALGLKTGGLLVSDSYNYANPSKNDLIVKGKIGIGTGAPNAKLHVINSNQNANGNTLILGPINQSNLRLGYHRNYSWIQSHGSKPLAINPLGNDVGIGTSNPKAKLHVAGGKGHAHFAKYGYLNAKGKTNYWDGSATNPVSISIWADQRMVSAEYMAKSDSRIKDIIGLSDANQDLKILQQIKVVDYHFKDKIANGSAIQKKVIGQQIAQIYPQAVDKNTKEFIPDIMQNGLIEKGWISLKDVKVKKGEKIRFIIDGNVEEHKVLAVKKSSFKISSNHIGSVFVYGREINDFHIVDYEALAMLNLSATQALIKIIKKQEEAIKLNQMVLNNLKPSPAIINKIES